MKRMKQALILMTCTILLCSCQGSTPSAMDSSLEGTAVAQETTKGNSHPKMQPLTEAISHQFTQPEGAEATTSVETAVVSTKAPGSTAGSEAFTVGNLNRNYANDGMYAEDDQWVWFTERPDRQLSRMRKNGDERFIFEDTEGIYQLNLMGDDLYYIQATADEPVGHIYRMKTDRSQVTQVSPVKVHIGGSCMVLNEWIYFINLEDGNRLCRMDIDGGNVTRINDFPASRLNAQDGWIYALLNTADPDSEESDLEIHQLRPDGTMDTLLTRTEFPMFLVDRCWLYYYAEGDRLRRMKVDGSEQQKVLDHPTYAFNVEGDFLYYTDGSTDRLMVSRLDGTDPKELLPFPTSGVQIAGDWFYTTDRTGRLFRMKSDGSGYEKAYSLPMVPPDPPGAPVVQGLGQPNANLTAKTEFAVSGEWIYQAVDSVEAGIRRIRQDGSDPEVLISRRAQGLNIVGDWIYFRDEDSFGSIARVRTDGSDYGIVHDTMVRQMIVRDEWIYFTEDQGERSLWKIRTDGTELTRLSKESVTHLNLEGGWLYWSRYYRDDWQSDGIHRTKIDGSSEETLLEAFVTAMTVGEGYIFYGSSEEPADSGRFRRMTTEGTDDEAFSLDAVTLIGVYQNWLYYSGPDQSGFSRVSPDGTKTQLLLSGGNYFDFHFIGDRIVFYDGSKHQFQTMGLDGADIRPLDPAESDGY